LPVKSQMTAKTTAITSKICISAPTPGRAKKPTAQSITIITTMVSNVFMKNAPTKS
jgi:hypothetical protein